MLAMLRQADRPALLTLLGVSLVKFATGILGIWGATNIYFFSYLHNHGTLITSLTNSVILLCAIVPSAFSMLFATRLSRVFGYRKVVRVCGVVFAVVPYIINVKLNLMVLGLCYLVIPVSCLSISSVPVLNCLWSQFPTHLNKVSGIAVLCFSLGAIVFNLIFVHIANPHNLQAQVNQKQQAYFPPEVADNIFTASNVIFLISGLCYIVGSLFIEKRDQRASDAQEPHEQLPQESPPAQTEQKAMQNQKAAQNAGNKIKVGDNIKRDEKQSKSSNDSADWQQQKLKVRSALLDSRFLILFGISYVSPLYLIYLTLYVKLIFMPLINDDHYLAYCAVVVTLAAIIAAPIWGCVGDHKGFKFTLVLVVLSDIVVKLLGIFCNQKWNIIILYFSLSFNDKGILTIIGPGLVEMFGLQMATQLIPYKGISLFMAYITVPIFQIMVSTYSAYKTLLIIFIVFSCGGVGLAIYFYRKIEMGGERQKELEQKNYLP